MKLLSPLKFTVMKILLVYPKRECNTSGFLNFFQQFFNKPHNHSRELLEISIQLPITWDRKFCNLNHNKLLTKDLKWADYVVIKADLQQRSSTLNIINKCKVAGKKVIAEGTLFDSQLNNFEQVDHLILNQATFDPLVRDMEQNNPKRIYIGTFRKNKLQRTAYSLLGFSNYFSRSIHTFSV